jgi:hypothetical protein
VKAPAVKAPLARARRTAKKVHASLNLEVLSEPFSYKISKSSTFLITTIVDQCCDTQCFCASECQ